MHDPFTPRDYTRSTMSADPVAILNDRITSAIRAAFPDAADSAQAMLAPSKNPQFGDFQCNAAMPLGKAVGKNPREVALAIKDKLDLNDIAEEPTIAGPGFINIKLKPSALVAALVALDTPTLGIESPAAADKQTVIVDLCGVNLAKQMHVGHLRATVIGDALARVWSRLGHNVIRQNHFGDWGLPIAMVTDAVKRGVESGKVDLNKLTLDDLEKLYRATKRHSEADHAGLAAARRYGLGPKALAELEAQVSGAEAAQAQSKAALVALQSHDPAYYKVWQRISEITLKSCFDICARLHADVTAQATAGESTYAEELAPLVDDLVKRGIAVESDGALVIRLEEFGIDQPLLVRKRDGGFLYATTDLAGIRRRVQKLGADRCIYAVDARQSLHFKQCFVASKKAGYARSPRTGRDAEFFHAAFGMVLGEDNRPFKTRSGDNIKLSDLLDEAVARAERAVAEKNPSLPPDERRKVAEAVGIGALKYIDLSTDRVKDYVFSFDRMLAFEGNTGPYLQYALVRIRSIFRKALEAGIDIPSRTPSANGGAYSVSTPEEKAIALELLKYPNVIRAAAEACEPHRLCAYLYDLAGAFSTFFNACPVLQAPDAATRDARLRLCALTGRILEDGLNTLGLVPLERM